MVKPPVKQGLFDLARILAAADSLNMRTLLQTARVTLRLNRLQKFEMIPVMHHSRFMKLLPVLIGVASVILSGCCSTTKENEQQAFEFELTESTLFMQTLTTLDSGDIAKTHRLAEVPVFVDIVSLPYFATHGHPTPEQKQELVALARQVLDYLQRHKSELDPRLPTIRAAMQGLRKIMTEPEDIRRWQGLSDYFAAAEITLEKDKP